MKKLTIFAMTVCLLVSAQASYAGYFYLNAGAGTGHNAGMPLTPSATFSTLAACDTASASATDLLQGCVENCNPASPVSIWYLEVIVERNGKFEGYRGVGPYGFQADCYAGIADAVAAGMTDVLAACTSVVQSKSTCK